MWKHKPGYGQLHPFGTECWIRVPKEGRLKNDLTTKKAIKGKLLHPNITGAGYLVVIQEEGRDVTLTSRDVVFRRPEGASEGNTTPMGTQRQHQGHLPDQQYRGTKSPNTEDASEDKEDQDQEPQKEASPPVVNGPQDQPLDYRDPSPQIEESEEEEDSDDEDPMLLRPRAPIRRRSPRLNIMQEMALASVHSAETQEDPQSYRAAMQDPRSDLWQEAINKELKSVKDTGTWQEVKVPEGASLVDSKWVFKTKLNERGEVIK